MHVGPPAKKVGPVNVEPIALETTEDCGQPGGPKLSGAFGGCPFPDEELVLELPLPPELEVVPPHAANVSATQRVATTAAMRMTGSWTSSGPVVYLTP